MLSQNFGILGFTKTSQNINYAQDQTTQHIDALGAIVAQLQTFSTILQANPVAIQQMAAIIQQIANLQNEMKSANDQIVNNIQSVQADMDMG